MGSSSSFRGMKTQWVSVYKFLYFTGVISHSFSHHQNNLPFISTARQGTQNASVSISKVHSIPHSGGNFPKDVIPLPLFLSLSNIQKRTHSTCMHACLCSLFIFVLSKHPAVSHLFLVSRWWKAPAVLSRNPSPPYVTDILPALFTSRVVIQSLLTVSTFVTGAGGKRRTALWIHALM